MKKSKKKMMAMFVLPTIILCLTTVFLFFVPSKSPEKGTKVIKTEVLPDGWVGSTIGDADVLWKSRVGDENTREYHFRFRHTTEMIEELRVLLGVEDVSYAGRVYSVKIEKAELFLWGDVSAKVVEVIGRHMIKSLENTVKELEDAIKEGREGVGIDNHNCGNDFIFRNKVNGKKKEEVKI